MMLPTGKKKIHVLVNGHDQKFWHPIQHLLEATALFEFKEDFWPGHNQHDPEKSLELLQWADVILSEWALGNAVFYSKNKLPHQKLVIRFHAQELRTDHPSQIDYENVACVIFVGPHVMQQAIEKFAIPPEKCRLLHNFVDVDRFHQKKFGGEDFNLGMIGIVPENKRLDRALDLLEALQHYDSRYMLHIKGPQPFTYGWLWARTKEREYYQAIYERINTSDKLRHRVVFDPPGNDVEHWLKKIGFILSPSNAESFHMALAEGMASGCVPITWRREGVGEIFEPNLLFDDTENAAKFIDMTRKSSSYSRLKAQSVDYIRKNFDKKTVVAEWERLLMPHTGSTTTAQVEQEKFRSVIVVWAIDAWHTFHRREMLEALAKNVGKDVAILVIEPGSHYRTLLEKGMCTETELKNFAMLKPAKLAENLFRIRVLSGGFPQGDDAIEVHSILRNAGQDYARTTEEAAQACFGKNCKIVHWIYKPDQARWVNGNPFIYEVYDEYTMDFSTGAIHPDVAELEPKVLHAADHVFFTSEPLAERKKQHCCAFTVVGNGVNIDAFDRFSTENPTTSNSRKAVGYLGNLSDFFDWSLMLDVCSRMTSVDFFFHGQIEYHRLASAAASVDEIKSLPNTFFSGRVPRPSGAAAIGRYDALIIPFVVNEAMHAVNPLKLWEYFAVGRPVISTPMDAITIGAPLVRIANTTEAWEQALTEALFTNNDGDAKSRKDLAEQCSWHALTSTHASVMKAIFENQGD